MRRCGEEDGDILEKIRLVARCRVRLSHPPERQLERFMRGELERQERHAIVRHLLAGCQRCITVTSRLWSLGDPAHRQPEASRGEP